MSEVVTHDLTNREWGNNYSILSIENEGINISLSGWRRGMSKGDYILIKNGEGSTRYVLDDISYYSDPSDMWTADATFSPREVE